MLLENKRNADSHSVQVLQSCPVMVLVQVPWACPKVSNGEGSGWRYSVSQAGNHKDCRGSCIGWAQTRTRLLSVSDVDARRSSL